METPQLTRVINFEVDVSDTSSMFCCMICQELIQSANDYRRCASQPGGDGCGGAICVPCISNLEKRQCPTCGDKYPGVFVSCPLIKKVIYPQISEKCPNAECDRSFLTVNYHMSECECRAITCPVCDVSIQIKNIHEHLRNSCTRPWGVCDIQPAKSWQDIIISICANPIDQDQLSATMCRVQLNPSGDVLTNINERVLYAWCVDDRVKFMCIQLGAADGEIQSLGINDDSKKITCPVSSFTYFAGAIELPITYFLACNIELGQGPWSMKIGGCYEIATGEDKDPMLPDFIARNFRDIGTFRGRLLEVLWAPPRGVFVSNSGQTYMANLDIQTMPNIKFINFIPDRQRQMFNAIPVGMNLFAPGTSGIITPSRHIPMTQMNSRPRDNNMYGAIRSAMATPVHDIRRPVLLSELLNSLSNTPNSVIATDCISGDYKTNEEKLNQPDSFGEIKTIESNAHGQDNALSEDNALSADDDIPDLIDESNHPTMSLMGEESKTTAHSDTEYHMREFDLLNEHIMHQIDDAQIEEAIAASLADVYHQS